jgi:hypothetical protein
MLSTLDKQYINRWSKILKGIEYLGGKCINCGESDPVLLDFHHKDKTNKIEDMSRILGAWVFSECIDELNRCVLLCAKCHRKTHFEQSRFDTLLPYIKLRMEKIDKVKSRMKQYELRKPEAIKLLNSNVSFREICKKTGMSRNAVKNLAKSMGINRIDFTNEIPIDENEFIKLYNDGKTYSFLCDHFNISMFPLHRIRKNLLDDGKIQRRKGAPSKITRNPRRGSPEQRELLWRYCPLGPD